MFLARKKQRRVCGCASLLALNEAIIEERDEMESIPVPRRTCYKRDCSDLI